MTPPLDTGTDPRPETVDAFCTCSACESRTAEMYDLPGRCLNCGQEFTVRNRKGDKAPTAVKCPACEVDEWSWPR